MKKLGICIVVGLISIILTTPSSYACVGARPMSMGGAFIAVADDANATYWNPAGLTQLEDSEFTYTPTLHNRDEVNYDDFVSFVTPLRLAKQQNWGSLGLSFVNSGFLHEFAWGEVERTDRWYWLSYGIRTFGDLSLGINLRDRNYEVEVTINPGWTVGGVPGPHSASVEDDTFAMDLALLWKLEKFSFGVLWQNMNEPELFGVEAIRNLRPGIAFRPDDKTVIALDMYDAAGETDGDLVDVSQDLCIGIERWFTENFALRAGSYLNNEAVTFGVGLKNIPEGGGFLSSAHLDYALMYWTDAPAGADEFTHQLGLTFTF